jgi:hypothetical protein
VVVGSAGGEPTEPGRHLGQPSAVGWCVIGVVDLDAGQSEVRQRLDKVLNVADCGVCKDGKAARCANDVDGLIGSANVLGDVERPASADKPLECVSDVLGSAAVNERTAFVNESVPQTLLGWTNNEYSAVYTQVKDPFRAGVTALQWRSQLTGADVLDWQAQNASLLSALQSQSASSYMIQVFVLIAVALGIASVLAISAQQKTRQIGILKAMGLSDGRSGLVFLLEALVLGVLGSLLGVALAYFFIWGFSFAPTPFTVTADPAFVLFSAGIGIGVALLSSIVPIRRTSKLDPIEVIQSG